MTSGRALVWWGPGLALALVAAALLVERRASESSLAGPDRLAADVATLLGAGLAPDDGTSAPPRWAVFEDRLLDRPASVALDALPFYDEAERAAFARSRWVGDPPSGRRGPLLAAPYGIRTLYDASAVSVHWENDPATRALESELPAGQRLAFHVYRSDGLGEPRLLAELDGSARLVRDTDLPLGRTRLAYQVWAVVLGSDGRPVAAEAGDLVSLEVPERFRIALAGGDTEACRIRVDVGPVGHEVSSDELRLEPGGALVVDGRPTGLVLQKLERVDSEALETRRRLAFRSDGSLVLDPDSQSPRTSETQVLVPVTRLVATLTDSTGATRTLELDLP